MKGSFEKEILDFKFIFELSLSLSFCLSVRFSVHFMLCCSAFDNFGYQLIHYCT